AWKDGRLADAMKAWRTVPDELSAARQADAQGGEPADGVVAALWPIAESYVRRGLWAEAAEHLGRTHAWFPTSTVTGAGASQFGLLADLDRLIRNEDGARRAFQELLDRFGGSDDPEVLRTVLLRCMTVVPGAANEARIAELVRRLTVTVQREN